MLADDQVRKKKRLFKQHPAREAAHPVVHGLGEGRTSLHVRFEELVREVLSKEGKHQTGALRVRDKLPPQQELLHHHLNIRQLFFSCSKPGTGIEANYGSKAKATRIHATESFLACCKAHFSSMHVKC